MTVTETVPFAPDEGVKQVISVLLTRTGEEHAADGVVPNWTVAPARNPVPKTDTLESPLGPPALRETLVTVGART